jgi:hypothetical protein
VARRRDQREERVAQSPTRSAAFRGDKHCNDRRVCPRPCLRVTARCLRFPSPHRTGMRALQYSRVLANARMLTSIHQMPKSGLAFIATHKTIFCSIGGLPRAANQRDWMASAQKSPAIQRGRTTGESGEERGSWTSVVFNHAAAPAAWRHDYGALDIACAAFPCMAGWRLICHRFAS